MKHILIDNECDLLDQNYFKAGAAVYIIKGKYKIKNKILLPPGSELRIERGDITYDNSEFDTQLNGIYLLCSNQTEIGSDKYKNLCVTSRAEIKEDDTTEDKTDSIQYKQTPTVFMREGDYIKNIEYDHFEMRLTANCRVLLPESTNNAHLQILSDKVNTIQIDGKCNFQLYADNCIFERIFDCPNGMEMVYRVDASKDTLDGSNDPITYPATNSVYSRFVNCEIFAEDFRLAHTIHNSNFFSLWTNVSNVAISQPNQEDENKYKNAVNEKIRTLGIINR